MVLTLLLVGLSMFATVIGNISSLLTEFDTDWLELQSKVFLLLLSSSSFLFLLIYS